MAQHDFIWLTASPLWKKHAGDASALQKPVIMRFETDEFMEDLFALVQKDPALIADKIAVWRRYGEPPDGAPANWATSKPAGAVLKLFQPVHGHFHLVAASLVCDTVGRPDHGAIPKQVGFVMRRLSLDAQTEFAWIAQPGKDAEHVWTQVPKGAEAKLADKEDMVRAFAVPYTDAGGHPRRLWAALVPASTPEVRSLAEIVPATSIELSSRYVLRAVYHKPDCPPSRQFIVSHPSEVFTIASYADRDAPARTAVIPLPKLPDPINALKSFRKNAKFIVRTPVGINANADKPKEMVSKNGAGEVCTLSIPIITLCAYIVLSIFLALLNIIFFWLPFIKFCFPIPKQLASEE